MKRLFLNLKLNQKSFLRSYIAEQQNGPSLKDFMQKTPKAILDEPPPFSSQDRGDEEQAVFVETYGCQMNHSDTEVLYGILAKAGGYKKAACVEKADWVLLMTCAIRENAESRIWARLDALAALARARPQHQPLQLGVLGCMAERLKGQLLERKRIVQVVCGPDAYRSLPGLLRDARNGQPAINVLLSADETYADVAPVRSDPASRTAFVSIMRGCNNMCTFCIVPFVRGRERSRPHQSIIEEVRELSEKDGIREITLLGQNVNSYCDEGKAKDLAESSSSTPSLSSPAFTSICPPKTGLRFPALLEMVAEACPNVRIRFTSPHPKDFPPDLLEVMQRRPNICKSIHLPLQSGSTSVLARMRRGYSREAYLDLVDSIRSRIPKITLSTDLIVGFCGEAEEDFGETLDVVRQVDYDMAYMFAYSMRERTAAHRRYTDDVAEPVKQDRLRRLIDQFYGGLAGKLAGLAAQRPQEILLVGGPSRKNPHSEWSGTSDGNRTIVFPIDQPVLEIATGQVRPITKGDWLKVTVNGLAGTTLRAIPEAILPRPFE